MCRAELRGLGAINDELNKEHVRLVALSVDPPKESKKVVEADRLPFSILSDENFDVVRQYGLVHPHGGPNGIDTTIPAHILIDRDGTILWKHISTRVPDRPDPDQVLEAVRSLRSA